MPEVAAAASAQRQSRDGWLARVLGVSLATARTAPPGLPPPGAAPDASSDGPRPRTRAAKPALTGIALWRAEREKAVAALTALEAAFRGTDHPERDQGIILLRAVRANLTETPATPQQIDELQRYLDTDDVVEAAELPNTFGVHVELREPLLKALAGLRPEHAAGETTP
jgi:hypothetical protein